MMVMSKPPLQGGGGQQGTVAGARTNHRERSAVMMVGRRVPGVVARGMGGVLVLWAESSGTTRKGCEEQWHHKERL